MRVPPIPTPLLLCARMQLYNAKGATGMSAVTSKSKTDVGYLYPQRGKGTGALGRSLHGALLYTSTRCSSTRCALHGALHALHGAVKGQNAATSGSATVARPRVCCRRQTILTGSVVKGQLVAGRNVGGRKERNRWARPTRPVPHLCRGSRLTARPSARLGLARPWRTRAAVPARHAGWARSCG